MSKIANRRSPSGPQVSLQLPFYEATLPLAAGTYFILLGRAGDAVLPASPPEDSPDQFYIPGSGPSSGVLDTLEIANKPIAATDTSNVTYQVYKNGSPVGDKIIMGNGNVGPMRADLTDVVVSRGDLIAISATHAGIVDSPVARIFLSWLPRGSI